MPPNGGLLYYAEDQRYCDERMQLIRVYKMLQSQVIETFEYIEPVHDNKDVYSLRYHQLYGNICAEIETNFRGILKTNRYERGRERDWDVERDFFKTNSALRLNEYEIESYFFEIANISDVTQPFVNWNTSSYAPLSWYREHNAVKHNRTLDFRNASLANTITALAGLYVLLYAQFGFLVDSISNNGVMTVFFEGNDHLPVGIKNEMGYRFRHTPAWNISDMYMFDWDTIKMDTNPYIIFPF